MSTLREYIITAHSYDDLDSLYHDLETPDTLGKSNCIPSRAIECCNPMPNTRTAHYMLSRDEAEQIKQDPRVIDVELTPEALGIRNVKQWTESTDYWSKSNTENTVDDRNWGILKSFDRSIVSDWGADGTINRSATLTSKLNGLNVDFIVMGDGTDPNSPEFAVNEDGTGGSRYFYVDWYNYRAFPPTSGYHNGLPDAPSPGDSHDHDHICGSIAFGNRQGWAKKSRYTNGNVEPEWVKLWHTNKTINPDTGFKNPTILSDSYLGIAVISSSYITSITYRGSVINGPFTTATNWSEYKLWMNDTGLSIYGINPYEITFLSYSASIRSRIEDMINAGVIYVVAAGNTRNYVDVPGGLDYDNSITWDDGYGPKTMYYNRGNSAFATGSISVGAIMNRAANTPSPRSTRGPGLSIWAPSRTTGSTWDPGSLNPDGTGLGYGYESYVQASRPDSLGYLPPVKNVRDNRNSNHYIIKTTDGTSYSTPQVAGVLGLYAELKPDMTAAEALAILQIVGDSSGVYSTSDNYYDPTGVAGGTRLALGFIDPTFNITANVSSLSTGLSVTYTITTTNVPIGSIVYLTETGSLIPIAGDFTDGVTRAPIRITSGSVTVTRTLSTSFSGYRTSALQLRTGGYSGTIQSTAADIILTHLVSNRNNIGSVFPSLNYTARPATGQVWPRPRIFRSSR